MGEAVKPTYDVFLSHAGEDKAEFVDFLTKALEVRGLKVWYDSHEIKLGDDFRQKMEQGLRQSRYGVVVLSPSFRKYWPEAELSAFFAQESILETKKILPVILSMTLEEVANSWPFLAARAVVHASAGVDAVVEEIAAAVLNEPSPTHRRSQLYGVPQRGTNHFLGREEAMDQLEAALQRSGSVRVAASIEGLAGIGKTELAVQLAHRLGKQGDFPGGIYWFDAQDPDLRSTWGGAIADAMGLPEAPVPGRAALAVRTVSRHPSPVLLVLDNVETWTRSQSPRPLPSGDHIRYLVTTRHRGLGGPQFDHVDVGVLKPPHDRNLLTHLSGRRLSGPGLDELLKHLGGHALALELAGVYLREFPETTPERYLARLQEGSGVEETVSDRVRYEGTVHQALGTLWEKLDEPARHAWRVAACFAPELVSVELSDAAGVDEEARHRLRRFHLIESEDTGRWRMHRLIRGFGRKEGTASELEEARRAFVEGCLSRAREIELSTGFRIYLPDRAHFDAAVDASPDVLEPSDASELKDRVGTARHSAGDFVGARTLFQEALDSDLRNLGEEHPTVAIRRSNLALVLKDLGELGQARTLLEQALDSDLRNLGEEHPTVAISRSNLAGVLQDLGELGQARTLAEQALDSGLRNLGEEHPKVATDRSILALVLKDLGELGQARTLLQQALDSDLRNLGEEHPYVAISRSNLALVLRDLGELGQARTLVEQALDSDLRNLGEDHPYVATDRSILAGVLKELERKDT